jgi:hypothetical protein
MGERLTAERVAELRALCEAATPGPWRADPEPVDAPGWVSAGDRHEPVAEVYGGTHNAALIAAARNALPDLLDALAERDAEIARLRERSGGCVAQDNGGRCGEPVLVGDVCYDHAKPCRTCGEPTKTGECQRGAFGADPHCRHCRGSGWVGDRDPIGCVCTDQWAGDKHNP